MYADLNSRIRFNDQFPTQKLIAVIIAHDKATTGLATKSESSIRLPKDLEGKRIAAPQGDGSRQLFPLFASLNKLNESSITWINVAPELRETMLLRGEADAISGDSPTIMPNILSMGQPESSIRLIPYSDYGLALYGKALIVKPEFAEKNPEAVRNFIRGVVHGINALITDPDAALASVKKRDPLLKDDIERGRIKMTLAYAFVTPNVLKNGYSAVDPTRLEGLLKELAQGLQLRPCRLPPTATPIGICRHAPSCAWRNRMGPAAGFPGVRAIARHSLKMSGSSARMGDLS